MKKKHSYSGGKIRLAIFIIALIIISIVCFYENCCLCDGHPKEESTDVGQAIEAFPEQITVVQKANLNYIRPYEYGTIVCRPAFKFGEILNRNEGDDYLLAKIAMAEAEGESIEGKAMVMLVVLNRVADESFPDTIGEVIFQHNGDIYQFSPVGSGRFYNVEPNDECWEALELVYSGWDESQGALFFESCKSKDSWHSRNLEQLLEFGGHRFYK